MDNDPNRRNRVLIVTSIVFILSVATLVFLARNPFEMTRVRNSLIAEEGRTGDFDWRPGEPPEGFRVESLAAPLYVNEVAGTIENASSPSALQRALGISKFLAAGTPAGGGTVQGTTAEAIRTITETNKGNCSDYTQAFVGLAHSLDVPVREWGMSYDGFSGRGHAFNEVFDSELGKWVFLDSYNSFYAVDRKSGLPLSALELREYLDLPAPLEKLQIVPIDKDAQGFLSDEITIEHYKAGVDQFYLWFSNAVFTYENEGPVRAASRFGRAAEQLVAIATGSHPTFRVYGTANSASAIRRLAIYRSAFGAALILAAGSVAVFAVSWFAARKRRRQEVPL